jgi:hypothetical protein
MSDVDEIHTTLTVNIFLFGKKAWAEWFKCEFTGTDSEKCWWLGSGA